MIVQFFFYQYFNIFHLEWFGRVIVVTLFERDKNELDSRYTILVWRTESECQQSQMIKFSPNKTLADILVKTLRNIAGLLKIW